MNNSFEAVKVLPEGTSDVLLLCQHIVSKKQFVIKKINDIAEYRVYAMLQTVNGNHCCRHFLKLEECFEVDRTPIKKDLYAVLEYAAGGDLITMMMLQQHGCSYNAGSTHAMQLLTQLTSAVKYLPMELGVAHRDISLENLF